jgi:hypothetical protein
MNKNPFLETLVIPYVRYIKRDVTQFKLMESGIEAKDYFDVEVTKSTRLYRHDENMQELLDLKAGAIKLFLWIIYNIHESSTFIKLTDTELMTVFQCSDRQVQRMRHELIRRAILAKRQGNEYWINPRYLSGSDRTKLYPGHATQIATIHLK